MGTGKKEEGKGCDIPSLKSYVVDR